MTEREKFLLRMAVIYALANLDDVSETYGWEDPGEISVNGERGDAPTEDELDHLLTHFLQ